MHAGCGEPGGLPSSPGRERRAYGFGRVRGERGELTARPRLLRRPQRVDDVRSRGPHRREEAAATPITTAKIRAARDAGESATRPDLRETLELTTESARRNTRASATREAPPTSASITIRQWLPRRSVA